MHYVGYDNQYWKEQSESGYMNIYGHHGGPIEKSPWTLPVTPRNQKKKLAYIERQFKIIVNSILRTDENNEPLLRAYSGAVELWDNRKRWVLANKL